MNIEENKSIQRHKAGRKPKSHPAIFRYTISLSEVENIEFLGRYDQSGMQVRANFITSCIFGKPLNVIKLDKGLIDYYMRLTTFYSQFRAIGVNYDQVVSTLKSDSPEKKALLLLSRLEKATIELARLNRQIMNLTQELEERIYGSDTQNLDQEARKKNNRKKE